MNKIHINQLQDKSAGSIQRNANQLLDDEYHDIIVGAAYTITTGYGKEIEGYWEYVTQFVGGATLWRDRESGETKIQEKPL